MKRHIGLAAILALALVSCGKKEDSKVQPQDLSTPVKPPHVSANPAPNAFQGVTQDATRKMYKGATMQRHVERFLEGLKYDFKKYNLNAVTLKSNGKRVIQAATEGTRWEQSKGYLLNDPKTIAFTLELSSFNARTSLFALPLTSYIDFNLPGGELLLDGVAVGAWFENKDYVVISDLCASNGRDTTETVFYNDHCKVLDAVNSTFHMQTVQVFSEVDRRQFSDIRDLRRQLGQLQAQVNRQHEDVMRQLVTLQGKVTLHDFEINLLFAALDDVDQANEAVKREVATLKEKLAELKTETGRIGGELLRIDQLRAGEIAALSTRVTNLQNELTPLKASVSRLTGRVTAVERALGKLQTALKRTNEKLARVQRKVDEARRRGASRVALERLAEKVNTIAGKVATAQSDIGKRVTVAAMETLKREVDDLADRLDELEGDESLR